MVATYAKRELPNYQVFDERRYFTPGRTACVFEAGAVGNKVKVGLLICEDAWFEEPARLTKEAGAGCWVLGAGERLEPGANSLWLYSIFPRKVL